MSSHYPPIHESRYAPNDRSRSPPRFQDRRPSAPFNPGFPNRQSDLSRIEAEPPRGPRGFNETPRGPAAPQGPRNRGGPSGSDYPELRNAPPLGSGRDRPPRERDFDRRIRAPSPPRPRSPSRIFRDVPPPRELDMNRARRDSRDGPISAGTTFSDPPPFTNAPMGRGGFGGRGRGRGRGGDFDFRDRGRRPPFEDRTSFRPRERSPPSRWGRDLSRGEREEWRSDRREDDRWEDRDRDADRFRRDQPANRFELRGPLETASRPQTPHQQPVPAISSISDRSTDPPRDEFSSRRPSTTTFPPPAKELRRDPPAQNELLAGRAEASNNRFRGSSPPPQAPSVPAFGSVSFNYSGPTSNVWKAPQDTRQPSAAGVPGPSPAAQSPAPKSAPIAPKAQLSGPPPAAPKAPRALEHASLPTGPREQMPATRPWNIPSALSIPTAPLALRNDDRVSQAIHTATARDASVPSTPLQTSAPSVPTSPRLSRQPSKSLSDARGEVPFGDQNVADRRRQSDAVSVAESRYDRSNFQPRSGTPPQSAPSGPRSSMSYSTSPNIIHTKIPTAPKADRQPPTAPRGLATQLPLSRPLDRPPLPPARASLGPPRAPAWNQWIRPGAPVHRDPVVPAKRDANGEEKEYRARMTPPAGPRESIVGDTPAEGKSQAFARDHLTRRVTASPEQDSRLKSPKPSNSSPVELQRTWDASTEQSLRNPDGNQNGTMDTETDESSDEDDMDLDEEDFESTRAKFEKQRARLQAQLVDLSERQYRAVTPLEHIARLAKISVDDLPAADEQSSSEDDQSLDGEEQSQVPSPDMDDEDDEQESLAPKEEYDEDIVMDESGVLDRILPVPKRQRSPDVINLPYLIKAPLTPLSERGTTLESITLQSNAKAAIMERFLTMDEEQFLLDGELADKYMEAYRTYKDIVRQLDEERNTKEEAERQRSLDPGPEVDVSAPPLETPTSEQSRRLHKFSSEYDIQKVLKESEETARIEQEKLDREAKRAKDDQEKEAAIPEMLDEAMRRRRLFLNTNNYRNPRRLTAVYGYVPPIDSLSEEEQRIFLDAFKERPKKWGEIASVLPGKTYQDCIHHYYAFKWDGRFRETKSKRKPRMARGRGGKGQARVRGAALMADLGRAEDDLAASMAGFSESGRPKRAATRTAYGDKESEGKSVAPIATPGKKGPATNGDPASEKPIKRRKAAAAAAAAGDKLQRKSKTQILAAAPSVSPLKADKDVQFRGADTSREQMARFEEANLLAAFQSGQNRAQAEMSSMYAPETMMRAAPMTELSERARGAGQSTLQQRPSASSYWSVPEQQDFMKFIAHFGTDFGAIASHMGTKTQTMVKNYYQRHIESGNRQELIDAANTANVRRERGEDMGEAPTPTPIVKRRYDNPQLVAPRTLAPHTDSMEVDEPMLNHAPHPGFATQSRFPTATQPTPDPSRSAPTPGQPLPVGASQSQVQSSSSRPAQVPGPKMGFFTESRTEPRPSIQPFVSARQSAPIPAAQSEVPQNPQHARMLREAQDPNSEWRRKLIQEQERAMELERISQEHVPQLPPHHPLYSQMSSQPPQNALAHTGPVDKQAYGEDRVPTPTLVDMSTPRPGQGMMRPIHGSPALSSLATTPLSQTMHMSQDPSLTKAVGFRPSSVPAGSSTQNPLKPAAAPEPRKVSNLSSILNSEPEEELSRPAKQMSDQGIPAMVNRTQSPASHTMASGTPGLINSGRPRGDTFGQASVPRSAFERSSFSQQGQTTHASSPALKQELLSRGGPSSAPPRQDWPSRGSMVHGQVSAPPNAGPPLALDRDRAFYSGHRPNAFSPLHTHSRGPSPPPPLAHPLSNHSRTSSFSQPGGPGQIREHPLQASQHPQGQQQPATRDSNIHALQSNPYGQTPGSAAHMSSMHPQQHNQMHHTHNNAVGPSLPVMHSRHVSREEEMARENERAYRDRLETDRMREAHYQAQHQDQQRFGQQPGPPQPLHAPLHQRPSTAFPSEHRLSLREQAEQDLAHAKFHDERLRYERGMREQGIREQGIREQEMKDHDAKMGMMRRREEDERRRYEEQLRAEGAYARRTPQGGGFPPTFRR